MIVEMDEPLPLAVVAVVVIVVVGGM